MELLSNFRYNVDDLQPGIIYALIASYSILLLSCAYNISYSVIKTKKLRKNKKLSFFYFVSILTIVCNLSLKIIDIVRIVEFSIDAAYKDYNKENTPPPYQASIEY